MRMLTPHPSAPVGSGFRTAHFLALAAVLFGCDGGARDQGNPATGQGGSSAGTGAAGQGGGASGGASGGATGGGAGTAGGLGAGTGGMTSGGNGGSNTSGSGGSEVTGGSGGAGGSVSGEVSGLPIPPGAGNVAQPSGAPGGLKVLDWAGFTGAVSYTFDDSNSSQIANYDALQALGVPYTFYLQTGKPESSNEIWAKAVEDGHELGNHTKSHQNDDTGADTDEASAFILEHFGVTAYTMAAPNGSAVYTDLAKTRFLINRGVANALIAPNDNTDPFTLPCYIPATGAPASAFNTQIDGARSEKKWRVVLVHGFSGGSDGAFQPVALSEFTASVEYAKGLGDLWIDTVLDIGAYWRGQKAFSEAQMTTGAQETTYVWTLPDHFPPGKFLRVTVDGGTLRQGDTTLAWNSNGFYEVALDAGSLTLGP